MRIGKKRAKFTVKILDNRENTKFKTKSFVFDNDLKNVNQLADLIIKLLNNYYKKGGKNE